MLYCRDIYGLIFRYYLAAIRKPADQSDTLVVENIRLDNLSLIVL